MKKLLFVYNPNAGKSKIRASLADIVEQFDRDGFQVTVCPTRRKGDATRIIFRSAGKYSRIVVSGGDGTWNEALCGIRQAAEKGKAIPDLGYIPAGSTNDFAISLGLPQDPLSAAQIASSGKAFQCDAGTFNGRPFAYVAAFGAFTQVSYSTPQETKNTLGHFAYVLEGIKSLPQIKGIPVTVQTDDQTFSGRYLYGMVSNSTSIGGFSDIYSGQAVSLNDGLLEVLLIKEPRSLAERSELMSDLLWANLRSRHITVLKTKKITFTADANVPWTLDGEFGGEPSNAEILAVHGAYNVVIPVLAALSREQENKEPQRELSQPL